MLMLKKFFNKKRISTISNTNLKFNFLDKIKTLKNNMNKSRNIKK